MSDERKYTEADMQRARREGYTRALRDEQGIGPDEWIEARARATYPIRKKKVPRVVESPVNYWWAATDPDGSGDVRFFRHEGAARAFARDRSGAYSADEPGFTWLEGGDRALVADLLTNPYEEVEE